MWESELDEKQEKRQKRLVQSKYKAIMKKNNRKIKRQRRTRSKMIGTKNMPRLSVFRSNSSIYAQLIDDENGVTIFGATEKLVKDIKGNKTERAKNLGIYIAKQAEEKKFKKIIFDRGSYRYHGRVKALAEGVREGGLIF